MPYFEGREYPATYILHYNSQDNRKKPLRGAFNVKWKQESRNIQFPFFSPKVIRFSIFLKNLGDILQLWMTFAKAKRKGRLKKGRLIRIMAGWLFLRIPKRPYRQKPLSCCWCHVKAAGLLQLYSCLWNIKRWHSGEIWGLDLSCYFRENANTG